MLTAAERAAHARAACRWAFPFERDGNRPGVEGRAGHLIVPRDEVEAIFATLPDAALAACAQAVSDPAFPEEVLHEFTRRAFRWLKQTLYLKPTVYAVDKDRGPADALNNWLIFADVVAAASRFDGSVVTVDVAVRELPFILKMHEERHHGAAADAPERRYADMDEAGQGAARAFVLARLLGANLRIWSPPSEEIVMLFQRHHREPLRVADLVNERRTLDAGVLGAILDSEAPAVAEGAL